MVLMIKVYDKAVSPEKVERFIEWEEELVHPIMRCHLMNISGGAQFHWHSWTKFSFRPTAGSLKTLQGKAQMVYELYTKKQWSCACGKCKGLKFKDMICDKCFEPIRLGVLKS